MHFKSGPPPVPQHQPTRAGTQLACPPHPRSPGLSTRSHPIPVAPAAVPGTSLSRSALLRAVAPSSGPRAPGEWPAPRIPSPGPAPSPAPLASRWSPERCAAGRRLSPATHSAAVVEEGITQDWGWLWCVHFMFKRKTTFLTHLSKTCTYLFW